jgi:RimJ/RimL family protein N-acetyltransferase
MISTGAGGEAVSSSGMKPRKSTLLTVGRYVLEPWREHHDQEFIEFIASETDVPGRMALGGYYANADQLATACRRWRQTWDEKDYGPYAILSGDEGVLRSVGFIGPHEIPGIEPPIWSAAIAAAHRRNGVVTAAGDLIGRQLDLRGSQTFVRADNFLVHDGLEKAGWRRLGEREHDGVPVVWYQRDN